MSSAREEMLARIAAALGDTPAPVIPSRTYHTTDTSPHAEQVARFAERVAEYRAQVTQVPAAALPDAIAARLAEQRIGRLVVPADLPDAWLPAGVDVVRDGAPVTLSHLELDAVDGVLTGSALGIAQTGTIVLDHGAHQGRRALTLIPDYHLCVVYAAQVVGLVPEALERLAGAFQNGQPFTFISGPSATSDIELNRVEGVHGPRTFDVLLVE